jgi:hypothetical protein
MLKYRDKWAFVSPHDGLGGPPSFVAISVVVIELWAVEAFCLTPVIVLSLLRG